MSENDPVLDPDPRDDSERRNDAGRRLRQGLPIPNEEKYVADEENTDQVKAFSTSGDSPLDGEPQSVPSLGEPVPGNVLDDEEETGQPRTNGQ